MELVLGVDGGGTKTVAWLATLKAQSAGKPLGSGHSGPGNPRSIGFETALANIDAAIDAAFVDAKLRPATIESACIALAGADRPVDRSHVEAWAARRRLSRQLQVVNDAEPILAAASPEAVGVALICGTGSFACGRSSSGAIARCGGWGYLFGDEGSGYDIALAGLRAAARAADGRNAPTLLLQNFQQRLGVTTPSGLVEAIYQPGTGRQQIADLSQVVFDAARQHDPCAREIIIQATDHLCELVQTLVRRLDLTTGEYSLALAGGVLMHWPEFCNAVVNRLADIDATPGSVTLVPEPVSGAIAMARRFGKNK